MADDGISDCSSTVFNDTSVSSIQSNPLKTFSIRTTTASRGSEESFRSVNLDLLSVSDDHSSITRQHPLATDLAARWKYVRVTLSPWRWPLITSIFAITCFSFLLYLAFVWDGKPLADWKIKSVSINAAVAAAGTALKGSLMVLIGSTISQARWSHFSSRHVPLRDLEYIDDAARGPWGSLLWLLRQPLNPSLVTVGSYLTLTATAFSFFAQQFVAIDLRFIVDPAAIAYFPSVQDVSVCEKSPWARAVSDGFLGLESEDGLAQCTASECTWNGLLSMGVCGSCADAADQLKSQSCSDFVSGDYKNSTISLCEHRIHTAGNDSKIYTIPAPGSAMGLVVVDALPQSLPLLEIFKYGPSVSHPTQECQQSKPLEVGSFGIFEMPAGVNNETQMVHFGTPSLTKCTFQFCMQNYTVQVRNGRRVKTDTVDTTVHWCDNNGTAFFNPTDDGSTTLDSFTVSTPDVPFGLFFDQYQLGAFTIDWHTGKWNLHRNQSYIREAPPLTGKPPSGKFRAYVRPSREYLSRLIRTRDNRKEWIDKFAWTITNAVRRQNSVSRLDDPYSGVAYSEQAYIKISWPWIVYPATILVVTLLAFATNVIATHWNGQNVWITGNLALLLSSVDNDISVQAQASHESHDALIDAVGQRQVRLERGGNGGWSFRQAL
ncbi:hypothetical protein JX265_005617 [Neoarthrinium moseri]|uniref:Uncharacterized protein n=1 Tax=Neoarthrinium moseri TaxID=1658444 RepID=A0A9P9WMM0_9PEZI|nr:hypothetical protein JX265_005617 [Neoarthrinium moseri]